MRVLVVWYANFNYVSSVTEAFNRIPDVVAQKFILESFNSQASSLEKLMTKVGLQYFERQYYDRVRSALIEVCKEQNIELLVLLNAGYREIVNDELFKYTRSSNVRIALWFVDSIRWSNSYDSHYLQQFDYIYSFDYEDIAYMRNHYRVEHAEYLPLGVDDVIYNYADIANSNKEYDICFVGVDDEKRLKTLEHVAQYCRKRNKKMIVYGQMWKQRPVLNKLKHEYKFKRKYPNLYKFVVNKFLNPEDVARLYSSSKVCLNIIKEGNSCNPRIFEILGTKSFQIIDYCDKVKMLFEDKKHLVMYRDLKELDRLLDYYLTDEKERDKIAQVGYDLTRKKYTITKLVGKMLVGIKKGDLL